MKNFAKRVSALVLALVVGAAALCPAALAAASLPDLPRDQCVVDDANVLSDSTTQTIVDLNNQLEQSCSGAQIGVLTVDYTGNYSTEDYATQAFNAWGIGDAANNNGVLILLVMESPIYEDGDYYVTYGDGFRNTTLESQASAIAQTMENDFAACDYDGAVTTCANNVADTIADIYGVSLSGGSYNDGGYAEPDDGPTTFEDVVLGIVILFMSLLVMLIIVLFVFRVFIAPIGHAVGWNWGPFAWGYMAGSARRRYRPGPPPPPGPGFGPGYGPGYGPGPRNDRPRPPRNNNRRPPRPPMGGGSFDLKKVHEKARAICEKYQFALDLDQKVYEMSVSQKQTLEIVKVLYRGADILILDEPTAVLTPQETERLFTVIRNMKADGKAVIIITHKLHEVLGISDRVAILRKGEYVGDIATRDADEATLTAMMVGEKVELNIERPEPVNPVKRLDIQHLTVRSADGITVLDDASFDVYGGEILGIAGISGNGQKELLEAIAGLQPTQRGASVEYYAPDTSAPVQLIGKSPKAIREAGIHLSFVPEDRLGMGLVGSMGMTDNMMLKSYGKGHSPIVDRKAPHDLAETIKKELNVVTPDLNTPVSRLSGGNVQKVLVGRELAADPIVLMTAYAVRGLDINTSYTIYHLLNEQKKKGVAVIYVGEDLDVLLELCDRIVVLCGGKVNGILDGRKTTKEEVGNRMTNLVKEVKA